MASAILLLNAAVGTNKKCQKKNLKLFFLLIVSTSSTVVENSNVVPVIKFNKRIVTIAEYTKL